MTREELEIILEDHRKWLHNENCGAKADLDFADLSGMDLTGLSFYEVSMRHVNLSSANLSGANLSHAIITNANLRGAGLNYTKLQYTNLYESNLILADLRSADLTCSYLYGVDMSFASLIDANLSEAVMNNANLHSACFRGANMRRANLSDSEMTDVDIRYANLCNARLDGAKINGVIYDETTSFFSIQCPEKGAFTGYKKLRDYIIELEIPEDAKRSSATSRKCRCSKAKVLNFYDKDKNLVDMEYLISFNFCKTVYRKGEMVYPDKWDEDRWNECSNGIHFFITFDEAKNY